MKEVSESLSIIIVNWNSGNQLKQCLSSIEKAKRRNFTLKEVIIVDNASSDGSLRGINSFNLPIRIIKNEENMGFAKACNIGARKATGDFILFLNPDVVVFENTFENLFEYIRKYDKPEIGIYGVQLLDNNGEIQRTCARFPNLWHLIIRALGLDLMRVRFFKSYRLNEWSHQETKEVDQVIGAFFLIKRPLFEKLNGFDERFFVYFEELDLSKRARNLGFKTKYVTEAKAYHKGGGTSEKVKGRRLFYNVRSRIIYAMKHFGFWKGLLLMSISFTLEPFLRIAYSFKRGNFRDALEVIKGYRDLYKNSIRIIREGLKK